MFLFHLLLLFLSKSLHPSFTQSLHKLINLQSLPFGWLEASLRLIVVEWMDQILMFILHEEVERIDLLISEFSTPNSLKQLQICPGEFDLFIVKFIGDFHPPFLIILSFYEGSYLI